jgi:hypothetical protein
MSCQNNDCGCGPSGYPTTNNDCCTDVIEYARFAYSSSQSAYANAQSAKESADQAVTTLQNAVTKTGSILPTYANNAAAIAGGLAVNSIYKTSTGELRIVV